MRLGVAYPNKGEWIDPKLALSFAREAEELGYEIFMTYDHYMLPDTNRTFEAWIFLTFIVSRTESIKVGTMVTPIPFRPPGMLAKIVSTLDYLSGGRVVLGVGAGWHRPEFEGFSSWRSAGDRVSMTEEGVKLILELWSGNKVDFRGEFYRAEGAIIDPLPLQRPRPPLWFGTTGKRMLRLAAKYGDGWIPGKMGVGEYSRLRSYIEEYRSRYGRSKDEFTYAMFYRVGHKLEDDRGALEKLKDSGLQLAVLDPVRVGPSRALEHVRKAWEILSNV